MNSITQDARYRYSIMQYAEKYGVARASRKYNKSRSYIYFWKKRYDGSMESLLCQSRRPHSHPQEHTQQELKLIRDMHRRNPKLGDRGTVGADAGAGIYALRGEPVASDAPGGTDCGEEGEGKEVQAKAV